MYVWDYSVTEMPMHMCVVCNSLPDTPGALPHGVAAVRNASINARNHYNATSAAAAAASMPLVRNDSVNVHFNPICISCYTRACVIHS